MAPSTARATACLRRTPPPVQAASPRRLRTGEANQSSTLSLQRASGRRAAASASSTSGLTSASPGVGRRERGCDLTLRRVAMRSPSSRERRATAASARASQPGTRCRQRRLYIIIGPSRQDARKHAAASPSPSHAPGSATATTRKPSAASSREPSEQVHDTVVERAPRAAACRRGHPRCKRCARRPE